MIRCEHCGTIPRGDDLRDPVTGRRIVSGKLWCDPCGRRVEGVRRVYVPGDLLHVAVHAWGVLAEKRRRIGLRDDPPGFEVTWRATPATFHTSTLPLTYDEVQYLRTVGQAS